MRTAESISAVGKRDFGPGLRAKSTPGRLRRGRRELQEVVRRAYQRPLDGNLADPSQQELAKSSPLLDLTEHRLDRLLPQPVATAAPAPPQLLPHRIHPSAQLDLSRSGRCSLPVFLTARGDVSVDVTPVELLQIVFRTIPSVGRHLPSLSFCVLFDLSRHRRKLLRVRGVVGQRLSYDHLAIGIDRSLSVVALNKPIVAFHDPAFGIGEVRLSRVLGRSRLVLPRPTRTTTVLLFALLARLRPRFGFQSSARLSNLLQPTLFVLHPIGQLLCAKLRSLLLIFPSIDSLRLAQPAADDRLPVPLRPSSSARSSS